MKKVAVKKQIQFKIIVNGGTIHNMYVLKCFYKRGRCLFVFFPYLLKGCSLFLFELCIYRFAGA